MVQAPAATKVAVVPLTVQTLVVCDAKPTVSPELAVAVSVSGVPTACVAGLLKVIVCCCNEAEVTVNVAESLVMLPAALLMLTVNEAPLSEEDVAGVV